MPYTLSFRQDKAFTDTVDLYAPTDFTKTSKRVTSGFGVASTATASGVRCRVQPSIEATVPGAVGRADYDVVDTLDVIRVHKDQTIGAGWYVKLTTDGHPEEGSWYITQGDSKNLNWRANERLLFMKKATKPPGVA